MIGTNYVNHDPSEISDSESNDERKMDSKKKYKEEIQNYLQGEIKSKSYNNHDDQGHLQPRDNSIPVEKLDASDGLFGALSGFYSQVKRSLFDIGSQPVSRSNTNHEVEDEDEDNGEISPDSLDPEPEDNFSNVVMQDKEQDGTNGVTLVGGKSRINTKKTNTRIASPGAQLENSNYLYM